MCGHVLPVALHDVQPTAVLYKHPLTTWVLSFDIHIFKPSHRAMLAHAHSLHACPTRLETRTEEFRACAGSLGG